MVEDEAFIVDDLVECFGDRNYKMVCFNNGRAALDGLKKEPVDILLVDIKLPGIEGNLLIEELAKTNAFPYVITISGDPVPPEMKAKLVELGCKDFVNKPYDIADLIELVKTVAVKKGLLG